MSAIPPFEFATAARILFGAGRLAEVPALAAGLGRRALLVVGSDPERATSFKGALEAQGVEVNVFSVSGEPAMATAQAAAERARQAACELVIGLGGGSVLDTGKAAAALLANPGEVMDYAEVIGHGRSLAQPAAPYIAIPTTAGTGAEVTRNAVLASPEHRVKVSLRSPLMLPRLAVVDPELTYGLPPQVTAASGLDALTQLIEPYTSNSANPLTDALCRDGIQRAARSLRRAYENGQDPAARADMALASLFGGLALANAKLGAVHGLAGPLGGLLTMPHGAICARLLPIVTRANVRALEARAPQSPALARYAEAAQLLTGRAGAGPAEAAAWLDDLCAALAVPSLGSFGLAEADIPEVVSQAQAASSMKGNPLPLSDQELSEVLRQAL